MDSHSYEIQEAALSPHSVQPISRGAGKRNVEPIEFNLTEHANTPINKRHSGGPTVFENIRYRADNFRLWLATRCCTCLSSIPSLALVLIAAVLIMLLVATIPLAFALTYMTPQARISDSRRDNSSTSSNVSDKKLQLNVERTHSAWPDPEDLLKYKDWEEYEPLRTTALLPANICSCSIYGLALNTSTDCDCTSCSGNFSALCNGTEKRCISKERVCDGHIDCPEGEDETGCLGVCQLPKLVLSPEKEVNEETTTVKNENSTNAAPSLGKPPVLCADNHLYEWTKACDGLKEACRFSCDECNNELAFQCRSHQTIHQNIGGDTQNITGIVENAVINKNESIAANNMTFRECIHRSMVCDGKTDCADGSDEVDCNCGAGTLKCNQYTKADIFIRRCYTESLKCDGYSDCVGGDDERECTNCSNGAILCRDEKRCVPSTARCDGTPDCVDESDEKNCTCQECAQHSKQMYMCEASQRCFPFDKVCTPYSICANATRMDKMFCAIRGHEYF